MERGIKETYSEVLSILNMLGEEYICKIPKKLIRVIEEGRNKAYTPKYDINIPIDKQNISRESLSIIALFHLNYWCNSQEEKEELEKIFAENEEKYKKELMEKYNPDNLFKEVREKEAQKAVQKEIVAVEKEKWYKTLLAKILYFFQKKK